MTGYPAEVAPPWLEALLSYPARVDVAVHIDPVAPVLAAPVLKRQRARLKSTRRLDADSGRRGDLLVEATACDATDLAERVARGAAKLFRVGTSLSTPRTVADLEQTLAGVRVAASGLELISRPMPRDGIGRDQQICDELAELLDSVFLGSAPIAVGSWSGSRSAAGPAEPNSSGSIRKDAVIGRMLPGARHVGLLNPAGGPQAVTRGAAVSGPRPVTWLFAAGLVVVGSVASGQPWVGDDVGDVAPDLTATRIFLLCWAQIRNGR